LKVVDAVLKVDTPRGPCWKRYNHDAYGQRDDGSSFQGWGVGRPWPLLTGERATYELAAGRDIDSLLLTIESFTTGIGLIPEQIWDAPDMPTKYLCFGGPTGAANPLMWAHSEYVKLLRSVVDKRVFDLIEPVAQRYHNDHPRPVIEVWKINRQVRRVPAGGLLRVQASSQFVLHWSTDGWKTTEDTPSTATVVGVEFADIQISAAQDGPVVFTFFWPLDGNWQGVDYHVEIIHAIQPSSSTRKVGSSE
jgi:glucoamylase